MRLSTNSIRVDSHFSERRGSQGSKRGFRKASSLEVRVENAKLSLQVTQLWAIAAVIISSLVITNALAFVVVHYGIFGGNSSSSIESTVLDPLSADASITVKFVQNWYRDLGQPVLRFHSALPTTLDPTTEDTCLDRLFLDMEIAVSSTSPNIVRLVLKNLGLADQALICRYLQELLREPQPLAPMNTATNQCLGSIKPVKKLACSLRERGQWDLGEVHQKSVLEYMANLAAVLEVLSSAMSDDSALLQAVEMVMSTSRRNFMKNSFHSIQFEDDSAQQQLILKRYDSASQALKAIVQAVSEDDVKLKTSFQTSILSGVGIDISLGHDPNARVGLALVAACSRSDSFTKDGTVRWRVGKDWADAYIAWAMTNIMGTAPLSLMLGLIIPSVSCAAGDETFVARRIIADALSAMHLYQSPVYNITIESESVETSIQEFIFNQVSMDRRSERYVVASAMGESTAAEVTLPSLSFETIEQTLGSLFCSNSDDDASVSNSAPTANLDDRQYRIYVCFVVWVTLLLAGLGSEFLMWLLYLYHGWSPRIEALWKIAQFVFPLGMTIAIGLAFAHDYLALLLTTICVWKFGFPETILYLQSAMFQDERTNVHRLADALNGVGTAVHHGATSMYIVLVLTKVFPPSRCVLDIAFPALMQHWFVLLKYISLTWYSVIETLLEAYFEWTMIANFECLYDASWVGGMAGASFLVGHWLYLIGGGVTLFISVVEGSENESDSLVYPNGPTMPRRPIWKHSRSSASIGRLTDPAVTDHEESGSGKTLPAPRKAVENEKTFVSSKSNSLSNPDGDVNCCDDWIGSVAAKSDGCGDTDQRCLAPTSTTDAKLVGDVVEAESDDEDRSLLA